MKFGVSAYNYQRYDIGSFDAAEKAKKAGRVGFKFETDKKGNTEKVRVNKKTGAVIKDKK